MQHLKNIRNIIVSGFKADMAAIAEFTGSVLMLIQPRGSRGEVRVSDIIDLGAARDRWAAQGLRAGQHRVGAALGTAAQNAA